MVTVVSLAVLLVGLVLGVFAMLYGTERRVQSNGAVLPHERTSDHVPAAEPSPFFNMASVGAFSVGFGLTGYLVAHRTTWPMSVQVVVAAVAGASAMGLQSLLIARWAIPGARAEHIDERYFLQGTLARVITAIPGGGEGRVRYSLDEREFELPSRDIDGGTIAVGNDVVIDRVEEGVAVVELWARVEQRL